MINFEQVSLERFLSAQKVKAVSFAIISSCVVASVVVCLLAIWDFAKSDVIWRMLTSFFVIGTGTALFTVVNRSFGDN